MLLETNLPVNEIALAPGFSAVKNFIFAFKKAEQTTPLKFRKLSTGQTDELV